MKVKDLKNHFLVAMPSITDPIFKKSLILICDDNKDVKMNNIKTIGTNSFNNYKQLKLYNIKSTMIS